MFAPCPVTAMWRFGRGFFEGDEEIWFPIRQINARQVQKIARRRTLLSKGGLRRSIRATSRPGGLCLRLTRPARWAEERSACRKDQVQLAAGPATIWIASRRRAKYGSLAVFVGLICISSGSGARIALRKPAPGCLHLQASCG